MPDDSPKSNQTIQTAAATLNNSVTTSVPQQLQYIVIDSSNGFLQAVPTTQITAVSSAPIKVEPMTNSCSSNASKMRTSVAIAPKIDPVYLPSTPYTTTTSINHTTSTKTNVSLGKDFLLQFTCFPVGNLNKCLQFMYNSHHTSIRWVRLKSVTIDGEPLTMKLNEGVAIKSITGLWNWAISYRPMVALQKLVIVDDLA